MHDRRGSAEETHNLVVVCVVPCVPYRHILDHMTVCDQDVVGLGAHLLSPAEHAPRPSILVP